MEADESLVRVGEAVYARYVAHGAAAVRSGIAKRECGIAPDIAELIDVGTDECDEQWANRISRRVREMTVSELAESGRVALLALIGLVQCFQRERCAGVGVGGDVPFDAGLQLLSGAIGWSDARAESGALSALVRDAEQRSQAASRALQERVADIDRRFLRDSALVQSKIRDIRYSTFQAPRRPRISLRRSNSYTRAYE